MKKITLFTIVILSLFTFANSYAIPKNSNDAKKAFQDKNYPIAIENFESLLINNPNDFWTLKYLGLSYLKNSNFPAAITYLERAESINAQSASIHYFLAEAYMLSSDKNSAEQKIDFIVKNFPNDIYAQKALNLKKGILASKKKQRKVLSLYLRQSYQYDSNVALEPQKNGIKNLDKDSSRFATYTWLELIMFQDTKWWAGTNFSFYQSLHTEHDSQRYNLSTFDFGPFVSLDTDFYDKIINHRVEYRYIHDIQNGSSFVRTNRIRYIASSFLAKWLYASIFVQVDFDDFFYRNLSRSNKDRLNRDAVQTTSGFRTLFLLPNKQTLAFGYSYINNDAEGLQWNYDKNRLYTEFATPLFIDKLRGYVLGEYYNRYFSPYSGSFYGKRSNRDDDYYSFRIKMKYTFNKNASFETSYRYIDNQSTIEDVFEYERQIFDCSLVFRY